MRADWLRDDLLAYTYTDVDRIYQGQGGTTAGITDAVNDGRTLVNYIGHGSGTSWGSRVLQQQPTCNALTNTTAWPWIIDVSCLNGDFSAIDVSFAEAWLRAGPPAQPYGAVGMYAASTSCPWVPPCVMQAETVDLLVRRDQQRLGVWCTRASWPCSTSTAPRAPACSSSSSTTSSATARSGAHARA